MGLMYSMEGTFVWVHKAEAFSKTLLQLYKGMNRIFSNHMASLEGGLALMEDKVKEEVAGLELHHMFLLCGNSTLRTHIPSIANFAHQDPRMEVVSGKHLEGATDTTRLESLMSFQQIQAWMSLGEKIVQVHL
jgi:hypothetical protein